jgi:23S rRNA (guanosine2251-2'-O)-methyltransferase
VDERAQPHEKLDALLALARERGVPMTLTPRARLDALSRTGSHNGVIAEADPLEPVPLPRIVAAARETGRLPWVVALGGAPDPEDLGAVLRTADAVGAAGAVLPPGEGPLLPAGARRVAMGAAEHLPLARAGLARVVAQAREAGLRVVAVVPDGDLPPHTAADLRGPLCLVLAADRAAVPFDVRRACDAVVTALADPPERTLPLSLLAAVVLYEKERQDRRG